ncbi:MAG: S-layer homology domain-containing protein [Clostridia bacterium]|nr:S-layer homology domain-containing protein [Clostridia bacterium]
MKNIKKVLSIMLLMFVMFSSLAVYASEEYVIKREMVYKNERSSELKNGFVEIMIGQKNFTKYQEDDNITITPAPDELREDEFGNLYAYYNVAGYMPGRVLKVTIERKVKVDTYNNEISVRSESSVDSNNALYIEEQTRVDSEEGKIIAKAKEITEGLSSDYKRALAIFEFVNTQMQYNSSSTYANKGSISALENKKGVCEEFATLYAAMCRAIDIPCKVIEGYRYEKKVVEDSDVVFDTTVGDYVLSEPVYEYEIINHVWNEIYFDDYGWVPVDTCVIYAPNGNRVAYTDAFCAIKNEEYIATGIYNYDKANRTMLGIKEQSYTEEIYPASEIVEVNHSFSDIGKYTWAEEAIDTLYEMGIIKGYTDTEYGPAGNVSRIEFITLLARVLQSMNYQPLEGGMVYYFMDYDKNHYSKQEYDYLMRCLEQENSYDKFAIGYYSISNIFGNSLDMNKPITRGEVVALLDSFLKFESDGNVNFNDIEGNKFKDSILKAYSNGLIKGYGDGSFRPNGTIKRAEIAVILDRYVGVKDYVI